MVTVSDVERVCVDPVEVGEDLDRFNRTVRVLSTEHPRLLEKYPLLWVALYDGEVRATGSTLQSVLAEVGRQELPREHVLVRFIERNPRTLIL